MNLRKLYFIVVIAFIAVMSINLNGQIEPPKHGDLPVKLPPQKTENDDRFCTAQIDCYNEDRTRKIGLVMCRGKNVCNVYANKIQCDGKFSNCSSKNAIIW